MSKRKKLIIVAAVLAIALIVGGILYLYPKWQMSKAHSVVYLSTGEIYIGGLSYLPFSKFELFNAYSLQVTKDLEDETKNNFQLVPLRDTLYSPKKLYLNPDQVVFYGPIEEGSSAGEALRNAGK